MRIHRCSTIPKTFRFLDWLYSSGSQPDYMLESLGVDVEGVRGWGEGFKKILMPRQLNLNL